MLALIEDFLFRILWIFNISVGHHVLEIVNDDLIGTIAGVLEIVRYTHEVSLIPSSPLNNCVNAAICAYNGSLHRLTADMVVCIHTCMFGLVEV